MTGKKTGKRLLTWVLVLVMALSLLPLNALADELVMAGDPDTSRTQRAEENGAHLVKSATKEGDTYQIQLESWVTGKVEQTTGSAPLDIVLVLDQSGSMEGEKLSNLKAAVTNFVAAINADADAHNVEHRIAIVGFARNGDDSWDNDGKWENTGLFVKGEFKKYITYTSSGYGEVYVLDNDKTYYVMQPGLFVDYAVKVSHNSEEASWGYWKYEGFHKVWVAVTPKENEDDANDSHTQFYEWREGGSQGLTDQDYKDALVSSGEDSIKTAISKLSAGGTTRASYGMEMANKVFENNPNTPSEGRSRVVVFFTDGEPGYSGYETDEAGRTIAQAHATKNTYDAKVFSVGMFDDPSDEVKNFMNYVSSNYPDANASEKSGSWEVTHGDKTDTKYYMTVGNDNLSDVFETISGSILKPGVTANADTVLTDTLSQYFDFDGVSVDEDGMVTGVTVQKQKYNGNGQAWGEPEPVDNVSVALAPATKTVTVSGFDYSAEENVVTDGTNPSGYKLVVTFNVKPDTNCTNWDVSGRYPTNSGKATLAKDGEEPFATVDSPKAFVETYQVTYKPGAGIGNVYTDQYYLNGAKTKVLENRFAAQEGYKFDCWKDENDTPYQVGDEITFGKSNVILTAQWKEIESPEPTPATVTLRETDANGNALINKHLTITAKEAETIQNAYFCVAVTAADDATEAVFTDPSYATTTTVKDMTRTSDGTAVEGSFVFPEQSVLTFTEEGTYTFTVKEVFDEHIKVNHTTYDDTEYTMTVNVTKDVTENKLNAAVSFKNGDDPVNEGYITFNNTYTAPAYPVYVYAFFAHNGTPLKGNVTVNGNPIEWNEDANNEYKEYFVTLGVYPNGTTKKPTDNAMGLDLDALKGKEYEPATGDGSGTKNSVTLDNITNYPSPYGKVCKGAAGYPKIRDELSWHLDGQVNVYTVTYDYNGGTAQGAHTSNGYYFGSYPIAAAPKRDGYTFTGWKDGDTTYQAKENITLEKDLKLVANWEKDESQTQKTSYTVQHKVDGKIIEEDTKTYTNTAWINETDPTIAIVPDSLSPKSYDGYKYVGMEPEIITDTVASGTTITLTYEKRTDLSYTVHYYLKNTTKKVADDKTVDGQTFNADVTENAIRISGYRVYGDSVKSITIGTGTNEIIFYYTRAYHPSTPSKPTLNTGDHYAYVMGYPDGTVRPNGSITRAEVSTILFRLLSDKTRDEYFTTESSFTDVKAGAWYNNSIATLEKAGVIVDTAKGGAFRPNEAITRAELAAMLAQFSDAKPVKGVKFSDVPAEHWAYEAIAIAAKMGWIEGYPDGTFRPDATITRAEMMTLVNRALERVPSDEDHLLSKRVMLTFPDCKSGDWFYIAVQEATNSHTYERAATEKNGDEQWTALRANRDWTLLEK